MRTISWIAIAVTIIMLVNLVLFGMGIVDWKVFWGITILGAIFAYGILPHIAKGHK